MRAASESKDASRNGLGRALVRPEQGDGELLAGAKPAQAQVPAPDPITMARPESVAIAPGNANAEIDGGIATFSTPDPEKAPPQAGLAVARLRAAIAPIVAQWRGDVPQVETIATAAGLPDRAKAGKDWQDADGFYDDATGTVYLVAENFYAPVRVNGELRVARLVVQEQKGGKYAYDLQQSDVLEKVTPARAPGLADRSGARQPETGLDGPAGQRDPGRIRGATDPANRTMPIAQLRDAVNAVDRPGWGFSQADAVNSPAFRRGWPDRTRTAPMICPLQELTQSLLILHNGGSCCARSSAG